MSKLTKTQLVDQLIALRAHCDAIETQLASAKAALAAALAAQLAPAPVRPAFVRHVYAPTDSQLAFRARCAAAKAAAMTTGRTVLA